MKLITRIMKSVRFRLLNRYQSFMVEHGRHFFPNRFKCKKTKYGFAMLVNPRLYVDYNIFFFGEYDKEMSVYFLDTLKPGMVFMDIGSCHGFFSLLAAQKVGPLGKVFAFEPNPANFRRVCENVEINKFANAEVFQVALCNIEGGVARFKMPDDSQGLIVDLRHKRRTRNNTGTGFLTSEQGDGTIEVARQTLDYFVEEHKISKIDVIKVDIEGAEKDFLEGAQCLRRFRPIICMEFNHGTCQRSGYAVEDLYNMLDQMGYEINWFCGGQLKKMTIEDIKKMKDVGDVYNAYCLPRSQ